jgi:hypothetical protein
MVLVHHMAHAHLHCGGHAFVCRDPGGGEDGTLREWVLQEGVDPDSGRAVLVDQESQAVYTWNKVGGWGVTARQAGWHAERMSGGQKQPGPASVT